MGYNKVIFGGETLLDLTVCTVTPELLAEGVTAFDAAGNLITGVGVLIGQAGTATNGQRGRNKIIYHGRTLIDLTPCTVTPETLAEGATAYNAAGALIIGVGVFADRVGVNVYGGVVIYESAKERHAFLSEN